jgi:hypothetical protein
LNSAIWQPLTIVAPDANGNVFVEDAVPVQTVSRFYRAVLLDD